MRTWSGLCCEKYIALNYWTPKKATHSSPACKRGSSKLREHLCSNTFHSLHTNVDTEGKLADSGPRINNLGQKEHLETSDSSLLTARGYCFEVHMQWERLCVSLPGGHSETTPCHQGRPRRWRRRRSSRWSASSRVPPGSPIQSGATGLLSELFSLIKAKQKSWFWDYAPKRDNKK